jgi:hypothetical protein
MMREIFIIRMVRFSSPAAPLLSMQLLDDPHRVTYVAGSRAYDDAHHS